MMINRLPFKSQPMNMVHTTPYGTQIWIGDYFAATNVHLLKQKEIQSGMLNSTQFLLRPLCLEFNTTSSIRSIIKSSMLSTFLVTKWLLTSKRLLNLSTMSFKTMTGLPIIFKKLQIDFLSWWRSTILCFFRRENWAAFTNCHVELYCFQYYLDQLNNLIL